MLVTPRGERVKKNFNFLWKVIRNFIGFTSQRFATSLENLHYLLNQSDAKPETNRDLVTCFYRTQ